IIWRVVSPPARWKEEQGSWLCLALGRTALRSTWGYMGPTVSTVVCTSASMTWRPQTSEVASRRVAARGLIQGRNSFQES
ncbi:unnamed protein product, partial [Gadus morhua 'NCC']